MTRVDGAWRTDPRTQAVCGALTAAGFRALFVGGCVRNALLGRPVADVDIATDAEPDAVMALAAAAGLHPVPTGIEHGTVTVVSDGRPFEVTSFRRDVETFGRHATVAFSTDLAEDAARRDFTMNALYAEPDGASSTRSAGSPTSAPAGSASSATRSSGSPRTSCASCASSASTPGTATLRAASTRDGLAACAALQEGLDGLSRERVGAEIAKLLAAPDPAPAVAAMAATGILARVLPGADPAPLAPLVHIEADAGAAPRWQRRLAALGWREDWAERLRLSRADARALAATAGALAAAEPDAVAAWRNGADVARDAALVRAAALGAPPPPGLEAEIARGAAAVFPVRAADLPLSGPALGAALRRLEARWAASGLRLDAAALLREADG